MASQTSQANMTTFVNTEDGVRAMVSVLTKLPTNPPELYIDLEGTNLCREGTLSIITIYVRCHKHTYVVDITTLKRLAFDTPGTSPPKITNNPIISTISSLKKVSNNNVPVNEQGQSIDLVTNINNQLTATTLQSKPVIVKDAPKGEPEPNNTATLKTILESRTIPKVFFDVRNDSDALFTHYGIRLGGIHDVQLMEVATRDYRRFVHGLAKCISRDAGLNWRQATEWQQVKNAGTVLFDQDDGTGVGVFDQRPLPDALLRYCVNDVIYLPRLRGKYWEQLSKSWKKRVLEESTARVRESQTSSYRPQGRQKAEAPAAWV